MAKRKQSWEDLLKQVNENLKGYGAKLVADDNDGEDLYTLEVHWTDGTTEEYASGYAEYELAEVISEAWSDVRCKAKERGDRIIRCIVHVDTTSAGTGVLNMNGRFFHKFELCGSEEEALRFMNRTLPDVLDDCCEMTSSEDLLAVNAALARQYDEPANLNAYAIIEDITEETIIKCSELFCEHHWSHEALTKVADELGIDLYDIEKN